jgi:small multidrug resistance family-3 protein
VGAQRRTRAATSALADDGPVAVTISDAPPDARERGAGAGCWQDAPVDILRSTALFIAAAIAEIGGAWLVWQGVREHRGWVWIGAGVIALGLYGFVATLQPDAHFGRILAAYGGVFVAGSLVWGIALDGFRPDRYDVGGALLCLVGVAVIMYAPRPS